jgi:signal transduction histidine kinase
MSIFAKLKPSFWDSGGKLKPVGQSYFDFRRIWKRAVMLMLGVAFIPLMALAYFDYQVTLKDSEKEIVLRTDRLVSNTKRGVSFFLEERKLALQFIVEDNNFSQLNDDSRLQNILDGLGKTIGGFADLGLFDATGRQVKYIGPYNLQGINYSQEQWFRAVVASGSYISDVYLGFREEPHLVIAVKKETADGSFFVLRTTLNTAAFNLQMAHVKESGFGESFLVNHEGVIQTPSVSYGRVLEKFPLSIPPFSEESRSLKIKDSRDEAIYMGYAYIPNTPFILLVIGKQKNLLGSWRNTRSIINIFLLVSVVLTIVVVHWLATSLVSDIHRADKERIVAMQEASQANKLASIGRLAAGIAHEINNPLAIINEKAGLLQDILKQPAAFNGVPDDRLVRTVDSIQRSVKRCAGITHRLLDFARPGENKIQQVVLLEVVEEILEFFHKDAEHRDITLLLNFDSDLPLITSDRGKLQQIFLNLINNALAALTKGGQLSISAKKKDQHLLITVADNGHGISDDDLKRIFEPFFSTKTLKGGTGLGLSITYGLVNELGGSIRVESTLHVGTTFTITLPLDCRST